jgi:hypothetical protein
MVALLLQVMDGQSAAAITLPTELMTAHRCDSEIM